MRSLVIWIMLVVGALGAQGVVAAQDPAREDALDQGMVNPGYHEKPEWFTNSFLHIGEDIAEAAAIGRRVLLYFYQDGCPYCAKLLQDNFGDRSIADKTRRAFDVIAINMWGDREVTGLDDQSTTEKAFAAGLRVQYTPTLVFLDEQGDVVLRINGYVAPHQFDAALDFVAGRHEQRGNFQAYYASRDPISANSGLNVMPGTLAPPLRLAERDDAKRPLLVLFERARCRPCDELHGDIFRREALVYALTNLDVAQVDPGSSAPLQTPDGRTMTARDWADELQIQYAPSLVFFDHQGREVFRSEAYLRSFHVHGAIDYVVSGAYRWQPSFQRFLQHRTKVLAEHGIEVELMD